jgi:hypothetical protein
VVKEAHMDNDVGLTPTIREEGLCELCHERPAEVLGLVCSECMDAIERDEPWTHEHEEVLFRLREAEADEEQLAAEP